ncbi:MAG: hypothetical protein ACI8RD_002120 [Bacillariaceae sp.]|jgi:hypothetical protein
MKTTIVDKDEWCTVEKQYETGIRFFPDILSEKRLGIIYPIQWMVIRDDGGYNLRNVSLIPLVTKLGIEQLQQFDLKLYLECVTSHRWL